jgi:uncharacterized protein (TIGR03067 family)
MNLRLLILSAAILAVAFAPAPFPKKEREARKSLLEQMQGWWAHTAEVQNGQPSALFGLRVHVEGDRLQYYVNQTQADGWTIKVDPSTKPASLDKMSLNSKSYVIPSRVSVEGDVMKIAWGGGNERPPDLSGTKGRAITFRRERR